MQLFFSGGGGGSANVSEKESVHNVLKLLETENKLKETPKLFSMLAKVGEMGRRRGLPRISDMSAKGFFKPFMLDFF